MEGAANGTRVRYKIGAWQVDVDAGRLARGAGRAGRRTTGMDCSAMGVRVRSSSAGAAHGRARAVSA